MTIAWLEARKMAMAVAALGSDRGAATSRLVRLAPAATGTLIEAVSRWVVARAWIREPVPRELYVPPERLPERWDEVARQAVEPNRPWPDTDSLMEPINQIDRRWSLSWLPDERSGWDNILADWARWDGLGWRPQGLIRLRVREKSLEANLQAWRYTLRADVWMRVCGARGQDGDLGVYEARFLAPVWWLTADMIVRSPQRRAPLYLLSDGAAAAAVFPILG